MKLTIEHFFSRNNHTGLVGVFLGILFAISFAVQSVAADSYSPVPSKGEKLITIHDRGDTRVVLTSATTIGTALQSAGIVLDSKDIVEPGLGHELVANDYSVNIYRARPVVVVDGQLRQRIMTPFQNVHDIAESAGLEINEEDELALGRTSDILTEGAGMRLDVDRATPFMLVLYGERNEMHTKATTVRGMLEEKDIELEDNDTISVDMSDAVSTGMTIEIWRNGVQTATEEEEVPFAIEQIQDADRDVGFREVREAGKPGLRNVTYEIEMRNGEEVNRREIQSVTTRQPKKQVEVVGIKADYTGGPLSDAQINFLGNCESGMVATRNSGNGFYGAFQFMPSTWRSVNTTHSMPHEAPLDVQKQAVQTLLSRSSIYTQFPGCARQMQASGLL